MRRTLRAQTRVGTKPIRFRTGTAWKIQGNWSNAACDAGLGYTDPDFGFSRGCIDGTN